jgi:hypothetical protein
MGFKSTLAIQAKTARSSLLGVKAGLRFKSPFPLIYRELIRTTLAGPEGKRHEWQRIKPAGTFIFFIRFTGYVFI